MFKYISAEDAQKVYDMGEIMDAVEEGYKLLNEGKVKMGPRVFIPTKEGGDFLYGAAVNLDSEYFVVRGSPFMPWNKNTGKPIVRGYYMLINFNDGELKVVVEGKDVVVWRTGAKSGVAAKYLTRENSEVLGIIGLGQQMKTQVEAISKVRDIKRVLAWTRTPENHKETIDHIKNATGIDVELVDIAEIMMQSDIVVVATHSKEPLINFKDSKKGQTILSISHSIEVNDDFVFNSDKVFVDYIETAKSEFGPYKSAVEKGYDGSKLNGDLTDLAAGKVKGRENDDDIILFQSLGVMHEDLAAVEYLLKKLG